MRRWRERACVHELPTATEDKSNTAQQTRATGTARDGVVVHAITKTNEKTNPSVSTIL
jgi:adenosylcobinamide amidohydrolase